MKPPIKIMRPIDGAAPGMPRASRKRADVEGPIHREILAYLRARYPGAIVHHSPNSIGLSGNQIMRQIASNEAMGTVKGFPDLQVILPGPRVVMIEVKAPGNYPDKDQRALHVALRDLGILVAVVRSVADTAAAIAAWDALPSASGAWVPNDYRDLRNQIIGGND